jgi:protein-tyrosine kinase
MQIDRSNVVPVPGRGVHGGNQIGALLIDAGILIPQDAEQILRYAKEKGLRFGDAAIGLGLVTREQIEKVVALQFDYAYVVPGESAVSHEVAAAYSPFSRQVEAFRALRTQLLLRWFGDDPDRRRLTILGMDRGDGRSYLAANLAVVFSQLGEHTLLVDADMRHPRQHAMFGLANSVGLSTMLSGRAGPEAVQRIPSFIALSVLPAGPLPPNPQELLNRSTFEQMLHEWGKQFDVILFDTCAASVAADAQVVAAKTKGALVLTRMHRTKMAQVRMLCEELAGTGASVIGTVLGR